jgi:hypothetical protein
MCSLKGSVNVPLENLGERLDEVAALCDGGGGVKKMFCLYCRRGIASEDATVKLHYRLAKVERFPNWFRYKISLVV